MNNNKRDIYLMGICGTGVGALAGFLKQQGHHVRGSDEQVYPPMSDKLKEWGIAVYDGYSVKNLEPAPDLVIVGNVIRANNPEAVWVREHGVPAMSMPQAIAEFGIGERHSVVVAGTHGKTTTTALAAHVLTHAGLDPSFLVGGIMVGYDDSFRVGQGAHFVIEGDEYDTAYFDKGPKFLHYRAKTAVVTSLEYDHADIFPSIAAVEDAFRRLILTLPPDGHLVLWNGAARACALADSARFPGKITRYATRAEAGAQLYLAAHHSGPQGLSFEPVLDGRSLGPMQVPLWGEHSAANVLAVVGALAPLGLSAAQLREGFGSFAGVRRRMEVRGEPRGVIVVDDFAHHPTAVAVTLAAARTRWPGQRLWAIFEPRSATTRRNVFQEQLVEAFAGADKVICASHERLAEIAPDSRFDPARLTMDLRARGVDAQFQPDVEAIVARVAVEAVAGDVVMILSNGSFGGLHDKLLRRLA